MNLRHSSLIQFVLIVILLALALFGLFRKTNILGARGGQVSKEDVQTDTVRITLAEREFAVVVADTPSTREQGLSGTDAIPHNGMLFVFERPSINQFWMKDMNYPIDIIWFDEDRTITHIEHSLSPSTFPQTFGPSDESLYILEISAGTAQRLNLAREQKFDFVR